MTNEQIIKIFKDYGFDLYREDPYCIIFKKDIATVTYYTTTYRVMLQTIKGESIVVDSIKDEDQLIDLLN